MRKFLFALSFLIVSTAAFGADENYNYVNPKLISPEFISYPEPNGSDKLKRQAAEIIKIQKSASAEDIAEAKDESNFQPELVTGDIEDHPATYKLVHNVSKDCNLIVSQAKDYWQITRPYLADKNIKLIIAPLNSYAYPSGHTACSLVTAEVYGQITGEYYGGSRERAAEIAEHRVLAGVHWPQDIEGGKEMALLIYGALQMSDSYQADLYAAQDEWQGAE